MRAVKHTDLYLSYTDKCMIDANCCDSTVFGSPFIFPTRWLIHTGSAPGIVSMLKHSARKQQCCFSLQMYITHSSISLSIKGWGKLPHINHTRHNHPSCVSAPCKTMFRRIWRQNIAFHWPRCCRRWSCYATISRVFAHLACRWRFLIDKFEPALAISLVHNCQNKFHPIRLDQCFTLAQCVFSSFDQFLQDRTRRQVSFLGITFLSTTLNLPELVDASDHCLTSLLGFLKYFCSPLHSAAKEFHSLTLHSPRTWSHLSVQPWTAKPSLCAHQDMRSTPTADQQLLTTTAHQQRH